MLRGTGDRLVDRMTHAKIIGIDDQQTRIGWIPQQAIGLAGFRSVAPV